MKKTKKQLLIMGFKDGIPIGLGYFAVAFSLGITAFRAGFNAFQGFFMSATMYASAGEYALIQSILSTSLFFEVVLITFIVNARYLLMSCALSQKINPDTKFFHRFIMGCFVTDELFGITATRKDYAEPFYLYGAVLFACPCWAIGTLLGVVVGNVLPTEVVNALSVSLYGMFLSVIIPQTKTNPVLAVTVLVSFVLSFLFSFFSVFDGISDSWKIIILTVAISTVVALICPVKDDNKEGLKANE